MSVVKIMKVNKTPQKRKLEQCPSQDVNSFKKLLRKNNITD